MSNVAHNLAKIWGAIGNQIDLMADNERYTINHIKNTVDVSFTDKSGKLHSDNGPASMRINSTHGYIEHFTYCQHGVAHRTDGPAICMYMWDAYKNISWLYSEVYKVDGKYHREDGPADITYALDNNHDAVVLSEDWHYHDMQHRVGGPACVSYELVNGKHCVESECWIQNNNYHRDDGPAVINYNNVGLDDTHVLSWPSSFEWYQHDNLHRTDGPAVIHYYTDGTMRRSWYIDGEAHRVDGPADIYTTFVTKRVMINKTYCIHGLKQNTVCPNVYYSALSTDQTRMAKYHTYYADDKLHNIMGPARIEYYYNHNRQVSRTHNLYYLNGQRANKSKQIAALLEANTNVALAAQQHITLAL